MVSNVGWILLPVQAIDQLQSPSDKCRDNIQNDALACSKTHVVSVYKVLEFSPSITRHDFQKLTTH